jgi:hypothetical protein
MIMNTKLDWTHTNVKIQDIRKLAKLYILYTDLLTDTKPYKPIGSLFINVEILEKRLTSYFLKDIHKISREDILSVNWNMYITQGYYIKIDKDCSIKEFPQLDKDKWYVSYLEISGDLGNFHNVYRDKEIELN